MSCMTLAKIGRTSAAGWSNAWLLPALACAWLASPAMLSAVSNAGSHKVEQQTWVTDVWIESTPVRDEYRLREEVKVRVVFSTVVNVTGVPQLGLTIGTHTRHADYAFGSGTTSLSFHYTVQATDRAANGVGVPADALILNRGTIKAPGSALNANLSLAGLTEDRRHSVDGRKSWVPVFARSKYTFRMAENAAGPVVLGRVSASDSAGVVRYALATEDEERFAVDSITGAVSYVGRGEDYERQSRILLHVRAAGPYGTALVDVTVALSDKNEAPVFPDTAYVFRLMEHVRGPVVVGTAKATDPDDGDKVKYDLKEGGSGLFRVSASTGTVRYVGSGEDYEGTGARRWTLVVEAADSAGLKSTKTVTVVLWNKNEAPTFPDTTYVFELAENVPGPVVVGTVRATDPDGDLLKYRLVSGDTGRFRVEASSGKVLYAGRGEDYDAASRKRWTLVVEAADTAGLRDRVTATVVLQNENEVPTFPDTAYAFELAENVPGPVTVGRVRATDPDGDILAYSLGTGDAARFDVHASSGVVRYQGRGEDYEGAGPSRWTLTVVATDRDDLTARTTVTVKLTDVNEAPAFTDSAYSFQLRENTRGPLTVGQVTAVDPDQRDVPRYRLAAGGSGRFQVDAANGLVRYVGRGEDYEATGPKRWVLTVEATDRRGLKSRTKATVELANENEAPAFADSAYSFELRENARGPLAVGQVRAVDPDRGDVPRYSLTAGGSGRFQVDAVSGSVRYVGRGEDYEAPGSKRWVLTVQAADRFGLKGWTRATVALVNVNEAPKPVGSIAPKTLEAYGAAAEEDLGLYFSDPEGDPLSYSAASSSPNVALVTVSALGRLSIAPQAIGVATATVTATDPGGLQAVQQVQVTVEAARAERSRALKLALAAFGRSLGAETVDAIAGRLGVASSSVLGRSHIQLGGRSVGCGAFAGGREACGAKSVLHGAAALLGVQLPHSGPGQLSHSGAGRQGPASPGRPEPPTLNPVSRDNLLSRSSFRLSFGGGPADPSARSVNAPVQSVPGSASGWTLWGQANAGKFEGRPDSAFALEGQTRSGYLGLDYRLPSGLLLGLAGSHSVMESDFESGINGEGAVDARLTSFYPYLHWSSRQGLNLWGVVGAGWGTADLTEKVGEDFTAGIDMLMAALGIRQALTRNFALKADAFGVRIHSDSVANLTGVAANAQRVRLAPELHGRWPMGGGMSLRTRLELGGRFDSGDAETGMGAEAAVQLGFSHDVVGLTVDARGRMLLVHQADEFQDWGASFALRLQPGRGAGGLMFSLEPSWGSAGDGARTLWQTQAGLVPQADLNHALPSTGLSTGTPDRVTAEIGYGVTTSGGGRLTPFGRWSREGATGYRVATGARWTPLGQPTDPNLPGRRLTINLLAEQFAAPMRPTARRLALQGTIGF